MENKPKPKKTVKKQSNSALVWSVKILILSFALSMCFGVISQLVLDESGLVLPIIVIVVFVAISIVFDAIGVATTSAISEPFRAMASRKVSGAKEALKLISKADRVASICCDVIGDVCGILAGAAGASILARIVIEGEALQIIIASLVSAIIASLTIFGKSFFKKIAIEKSTPIVLFVGKVVGFFTPKSKENPSKQKQEENESKDKNEDEE